MTRLSLRVRSPWTCKGQPLADVLGVERAQGLPEEEEGGETYWVGTLSGRDGAAAGYDIHLAATLRIGGGALAGEGFGHRKLDTHGQPMTFVGTAVAGAVCFRTDMHAQDITLSFDLVGDVDASLTRMAGSFRFGCIRPERCGCAGGGGTFWMQRNREICD